MSVDFRTRIDSDQTSVEPISFFETTLPQAFENAIDLLAPAVAFLSPLPLTISVGDCHWTLWRRVDRILIDRGKINSTAELRLDRSQLSDLVADRVTPNGWFTRGTLSSNTSLAHLLDWWLLVRGALDCLRPYVPSSISFRTETGSPLNLSRPFALGSSTESMRHFLEETGFLHVADVFTELEMKEICDDMEQLRGKYSPDDGRSLWSHTSTGEKHLVRMQYYDAVSRCAAALLSDQRLLGIASITGDRHEPNQEAGHVEALIKLTGIVDGLSDFPWHKDCSLGRHSYECCSLVVGISLTASDSRMGQLRVIAGSHRGLTWPVFRQPGLDLPVVALPTTIGDVTVHLSCTLHMSQPPVIGERRVLYVGFRLPGLGSDAAKCARHRSGLRTTDLM